MALASGKCPKCGEIIKVNAEKESGFCSKCGQQIDVQQNLHPDVIYNKTTASRRWFSLFT